MEQDKPKSQKEERQPSRDDEDTILKLRQEGIVFVGMKFPKIALDDRESIADEVLSKYHRRYKKGWFYPLPRTLTRHLKERLRFAAIDHFRKVKGRSESGPRRPAVSIEECRFPVDADPARRADTKEAIEYVCKFLTRSEAELINLRYFEDKSYEEIAAILRKTYDTAKQRHSRVIKKLRKLWTKHFGSWVRRKRGAK